ncbi:MAG: hypothetical protein HRT35_22085 [Algicola sp.]|nr:hypothetical protein [Algicola sp.]
MGRNDQATERHPPEKVLHHGRKGYCVEVTCHIPIILLTAKGDLSSRMTGWQHHVDAYITKPFHQQELSLRIKNLLSVLPM